MKRQDALILILVFTGLFLTGAGGHFEIHTLKGVGITLAGAGGCLALFANCQEGVIRMNWGVVRRAECLKCFRFEAAFWWVILAGWTILGILVTLGILDHRKP